MELIAYILIGFAVFGKVYNDRKKGPRDPWDDEMTWAVPAILAGLFWPAFALGSLSIRLAKAYL